MRYRKQWLFAAGLGLAVLLGWGGRAQADEVNYYFPPMAAYPSYGPYAPYGPYMAPGGDYMVPPVVIIGDPVIYDSRYDETRWEREQRQNFHPGYQSWSDYYESPPWHHRDENDFNPWWTR